MKDSLGQKQPDNYYALYVQQQTSWQKFKRRLGQRIGPLISACILLLGAIYAFSAKSDEVAPEPRSTTISQETPRNRTPLTPNVDTLLQLSETTKVFIQEDSILVPITSAVYELQSGKVLLSTSTKVVVNMLEHKVEISSGLVLIDTQDSVAVYVLSGTSLVTDKVQNTYHVTQDNYWSEKSKKSEKFLESIRTEDSFIVSGLDALDIDEPKEMPSTTIEETPQDVT